MPCAASTPPTSSSWTPPCAAPRSTTSSSHSPATRPRANHRRAHTEGSDGAGGLGDGRERPRRSGQARLEPYAQRQLARPERLGGELDPALPRRCGLAGRRSADRLRGPRRRNRGAGFLGPRARGGKRAAGSCRFRGTRLHRHARRGRGALCDPDPESGRPAADDLTLQHLSRADQTVVAGPEAITRRADDYRALADRIRRARCDLVYYGGIIQSGAGALWRDIREGIPQIRMLAPDALFERAFLTDAGEAAEGTLITFGGIPSALLEGEGARFYERYKRTYGVEPESYAGSTYDAVTVILQAIETVGRRDRGAITEAVLATRDHEGLLGRWSFDENGDIDLSTITRIEVRDSDFAYLGTAELAPAVTLASTGGRRAPA